MRQRNGGGKLERRRRELRRQRQRKRRKRRILVLAVEVFLLCILGVTAYTMFKLDKLNTTSVDGLMNNGLSQEGYLNVALFGTDNRPGESEGVRSDCIIVASLNNETKEVKLLSVYRDTFLKTGDDIFEKANSAYASGGPEAAINMLNRNLDLDIENYVAVNFLALADVVDLLGGIELELTDEEVAHMNNYCVETSEITQKTYERIEPETAGTYHLNGVQAVSYSRIRYTEGGDFKRTSRQREVLALIAEKVQDMSLSTINKIIDSVFPQVSTNFTLAEMVAYAKDVKKYTVGESMGFPENNTFADLDVIGSVVIADTLTSNVLEVHKFLFGSDGYTVPAEIEKIEKDIQIKAAAPSGGGDSWNSAYGGTTGWDAGTGSNNSWGTATGGYGDNSWDDGSGGTGWDNGSGGTGWDDGSGGTGWDDGSGGTGWDDGSGGTGWGDGTGGDGTSLQSYE